MTTFQGSSSRPAGEQVTSAGTLLSHAEDIASVIRTLPATPILAGHSFGGLILQRYLVAHRDDPARFPAVAGVVAMGSNPPQGTDFSRYLVKAPIQAIKVRYGSLWSPSLHLKMGDSAGLSAAQAEFFFFFPHVTVQLSPWSMPIVKKCFIPGQSKRLKFAQSPWHIFGNLRAATQLCSAGLPVFFMFWCQSSPTVQDPCAPAYHDTSGSVVLLCLCYSCCRVSAAG